MRRPRINEAVDYQTYFDFAVRERPGHRHPLVASGGHGYCGQVVLPGFDPGFRTAEEYLKNNRPRTAR